MKKNSHGGRRAGAGGRTKPKGEHVERCTITLPPGLRLRVRAVVGPRGFSPFLAAAAQEKLARIAAGEDPSAAPTE